MKALLSVKYPIQTVLVRKSGTRFLQNFFYLLEKDVLPGKRVDIESSKVLRFEEPSPRIGPVTDVRFVFVRDPFDRFIAFYRDHILTDEIASLSDWRENLAQRGVVVSDQLTAVQHQHNLRYLLDEIRDFSNTNGFTNLPDFLAPQYKFVLPALDHGFKPLELLRAKFELPELLARDVPDVKKLLQRTARRVEPFRSNIANEFRIENIVNAHKKIYEADYELYWANRDGKA